MEHQLPGGGYVDVSLAKGGFKVAIEIWLTTPLEHEVENVRKSFAAGYSLVITLAPGKRQQDKLRRALEAILPATDTTRFHCLSSREDVTKLLTEELEKAPSAPTKVKGYRVTTKVKVQSAEDNEHRNDDVKRTLAEDAAKRLAGRKPRPPTPESLSETDAPT